MIDLRLMDSLTSALPDYSHFVVVGDKDQLPSVGAGNVLSKFSMRWCCPQATVCVQRTCLQVAYFPPFI